MPNRIKNIAAKGRQDKRKYTVAIIGCGNIGFFFDHKRKGKGALSHFKAFAQHKDFEVVALAEHKPERRALLSKVCRVPVFYDHKELLTQVHPDVVVVATSNQSHEPILRDLLAAKPKLVFAEKPLTLDADSSQELIAAYEKAGIGLMINYTRRFVDIFAGIKRSLEQKKLGDVQAANIFYSRGFFHNGSHFLDLVTWFWGAPQDTLIESERPGLQENDPTLSVLLKYPGGMEVRLIGLATSTTAVCEIDIWGSKGRVRVSNNELFEFYQVVKSKNFRGYSVYALKAQKKYDHTAALPQAVDNIAGWLKGKAPLISPAKDSLLSFQLFKRVKEPMHA